MHSFYISRLFQSVYKAYVYLDLSLIIIKYKKCEHTKEYPICQTDKDDNIYKSEALKSEERTNKQ